MKYIIYCFLIVHALNANALIIMNNQEYMIDDIYKEYGKHEWENMSRHQQEELINDFINRHLAVIEANRLGFKNKPDVAKKLYDRGQIALINVTYEELVAKPLLSTELLSITKQNIVEERLLHHILISYDNARIQNPPNQNKEDALILANQISEELNNIKTNQNNIFIDYAMKYSNDPTVHQNEGRLDWITWGRTVPTFQEAAFELNPGTFSNPILTDFGYHIIYCEELRPSEYAKLNSDDLENIVYTVAKNSIVNQLKPAAEKYDSLQLSNSRLTYDEQKLEAVLNQIVQQINKNKISGQYKLDLVSIFEETPTMGVIATFNNKTYGLKWFAERLRMIPSGRQPQINDFESLKKALDIIVLQYLAVEDAMNHNIQKSSIYLQQMNQIEYSLLYDQYLKWLVNNAEPPNESDIINYYEQHKEQKYLENEKVSIREIKVLDKNFADSLYLELKHGANFNTVAMEHSKTNPGGGGLITPFVKGKYNYVGEAAFSLNSGETSVVIENLDRTYSIIKVESFINPEYIPIDNVYNRIESILKRNNQKIAKQNGLKNLHQKYNVIINQEAF